MLHVRFFYIQLRQNISPGLRLHHYAYAKSQTGLFFAAAVHTYIMYEYILHTYMYICSVYVFMYIY